MPLNEIRLQNFKCFEDSQAIPLAPLTVIFGRNNSGKSSILQSLLLLRQTLDSPEHGVRLNLRGPLYAAGSFADLVHQHQSDRHVVMRLGVLLPDNGPSGRVELEFASDEPQPPRLIRIRVDAVGRLDLDPLEFRRGRGAGGPFELVIGGQPIGGETDANFKFPVDRFIPLVGPEPPQRGRPSVRRAESRSFATKVLEELVATLREIRAVGAFRHQPARRYEYQGRAPEIVDATGQYVVNALIEDITRRGRRRGLLFRNVNRWLKAVGRVRLLPLRRISRSARLYELRLRDTDTGRWANFADVGFGIGQALPVLVQGLATPLGGGTFLVQEPEMHLHPDAQLQMADFLISLARSGRRTIVETHSEHLLLRIRRSVIATKNGPPLNPSDVSIVYVDKSSTGTSTAKSLPVDELGQVTSWPRDFMEEATQERMAIMERIADRVETCPKSR